MCFPAYIVGILFIALIVYDIVKKEYSSLTNHGIVGVCLTLILWILCILVGEEISMGVLVVPIIFVIIFLLSIWFMNESFKKRGCCMNCSGDSPKKGSCRIVKREKPSDSCAAPPPPPPPNACPGKLTATPV
jgi:uncharacterized membrane protein